MAAGGVRPTWCAPQADVPPHPRAAEGRSRSSWQPSWHAHGACLRTEEERHGFQRTDEEALRLPKARRAIGRGEPLGGDKRHGRPEARRRSAGSLRPAVRRAGTGGGRRPAGAAGQDEVPQDAAATGGAGGVARTGRRGGVGLASAPGLASALGSCPGRASALGMWTGAGAGQSRVGDAASRPVPDGHGACQGGRVSQAWGSGTPDARRSGGPSRGPLAIPGPPAPSAGTAGATTAGRTPAGPRPAGTRGGSPKRRGAGGHPRARRGRCPEPPDAVIPSAPVVQAGHQIVEGAGRAHVSGSSPAGGAQAGRPSGARSPRLQHTAERVVRGGYRGFLVSGSLCSNLLGRCQVFFSFFPCGQNIQTRHALCSYKPYQGK